LAPDPEALPVLAVGGAASAGDGVANSIKLAAYDVQILVVRCCGQFVAEDAFEEMLAALAAFRSRTGPDAQRRRSELVCCRGTSPS
jgi:hypothetical protein